MRVALHEKPGSLSESGATTVTPAAEALGSLERSCDRRGLPSMASRLRELNELTAADLADCERLLDLVPQGAGLVHRAAAHLIGLRGKRLRPLCVALAARLGSGFGAGARDLAVAVELVHSATLLHDDVVDLGELRRGAPAARLIYGNTAAIFAGDLLLVEALRRVARAGVPGALERLLDAIDDMIVAESRQLENRGRVDLDLEGYLGIITGKTAALFRWAMFVGGRAGGLALEACAALEAFGLHLGIAFQLVDDLLDLSGEPEAIGKSLLVDLSEGQMTLPLIVALGRDPGVRPLLEEVIQKGSAGEAPTEASIGWLLHAIRTAGGFEACRNLADREAALAIQSLRSLPACAARDSLEVVAQAAVERDR